MIAGFWMPNQSWDGCKVNDPSARFFPIMETAENNKQKLNGTYLAHKIFAKGDKLRCVYDLGSMRNAGYSA